MSESTVTDIDKELDRHQKRRDDNIPTVSVILGPPLLARFHWQEWSRKRSKPVAETNVLSLEQAVASWVDHLANHVDLVGEARKQLAESIRKLSSGLSQLETTQGLGKGFRLKQTL